MLPGQIIRNTVASLLAWGAGLAASIATWALISRTLGPERMGYYSYAIWLSALLVTLATLGLPTTVQKYVAEYHGKGNQSHSETVIKRLLKAQVLAVIFVTVAAAVVFVFFRPGLQISTVLLIVTTVAPGAIQLTLTEILRGFQRFEKAASISLACSVAQVAAVAIGIKFGGGVATMLIANLFAMILGTVLAVRALLPSMSGRNGDTVSLGSETTRRLWRFSIVFSYTSLLEYVIWEKSEVLFLRYFSSLENVAFYSIAFAMAAKVIGIAGALSSTLLPLSSFYYGRDSTDKINEVYRQGCRFMVMLLLPICAAGIALAAPVIRLLYGTSYAPVEAPLLVMLVGIPFASLSVVGWAVISAVERQSSILWIMSAGVPINVALDWYFVQHYHALGAAVANTIAQLIIAFLLLASAAKFTGARYPWQSTLRIIACTLVAAAPVWFLRPTSIVLLCFSVAGGIALYGALLFLSREIGSVELGWVRNALLARAGADELKSTADVL